MALVPPQSLVLCYKSRSVAVRRPATLDELYDEARIIFSLPRNATIIFHYLTPSHSTRTRTRSASPQVQGPSKRLRIHTGDRSEHNATSTVEEDEVKEEVDSDDMFVEPEPPKRTKQLSISKKRELGASLLPYLPDDFELHVQLVQPIDSKGKSRADPVDPAVPASRARETDSTHDLLSERQSDQLSQANLSIHDAALKDQVDMQRAARARRFVLDFGPDVQARALPTGPLPSGVEDVKDGVMRCIVCNWEIVSGECASCHREYQKAPARFRNEFERDPCPECRYEMMKESDAYMCVNERCHFECPFEGNSEYSDVTSVDYAFEDESDAASENHPYGHHPEIVYDSDTSTVESDYLESSAIFTDPAAGERSDSSSESGTEEGEVLGEVADNGSSDHEDEIILVEEIHA